MTPERWTAVDDYIARTLIPPDAALEAALVGSTEGGLPAIQVSAAQGKFLHLLAQVQGARMILELGTLGGYSTIWLARALPEGGHLISVELEAKHAEVARRNVARAGLEAQVEIRVGPALAVLEQLAGEGAGPFDLIFIDADKASIPEYFQWALKLSRPGSLIIADNTVRNGALVEAESTDANIRGVRRLHEMLNQEKRVSATTLQTVGCKGYDGFTMALVVGPTPPPGLRSRSPRN